MKKRFSACLFAVSAIFALAGEIGGVSLPDTLQVGGQDLVLNGAGLRKKLFIKVYAGGLYLKEKSDDAQKIIEADEAMVLRMHFIYNGVSAKKLTDAWNEGFQASTGGDTASIQTEIDQFNALFTAEAKKNDVYDIIYQPDKGVEVVFNGESQGVVAGLSFKKAVFGIWLGEKLADSNLKSVKTGLLGQ